MKINTILLTGIMILTFAGSAMAAKPLDGYSFIRGVCYPGGWRNDSTIIQRDLGYAKRLQLNSTRVWLSPSSYQRDQEAIRKFALELGQTLKQCCGLL